MSSQLAYRRILLKLSGEALGRVAQGIDPAAVRQVVNELKSVRRLGVELAVVIGAGNLWRKRKQGQGMDEVTADYLGMVATVMNALALASALRRAQVPVLVQSSLAADVAGVRPVNAAAARRALARKTVVIFAGGTGRPFFTTDTAAAMRAAEIKADVIIKAGPVDGVYSADPRIKKGATKYRVLTVHQALQRQLKVMDTQAFRLCLKRRIPIVVCKWKRAVLTKVVKGATLGTLVTP